MHCDTSCWQHWQCYIELTIKHRGRIEGLFLPCVKPNVIIRGSKPLQTKLASDGFLLHLFSKPRHVQLWIFRVIVGQIQCIRFSSGVVVMVRIFHTHRWISISLDAVSFWLLCPFLNFGVRGWSIAPHGRRECDKPEISPAIDMGCWTIQQKPKLYEIYYL